MSDATTPPKPNPPSSVRLDKWLWSVRAFKTRSLATAACRNGHVRVDGAAAKPSREVRANDRVQIKLAGLTRDLRLVAPLERRVSAKAAEAYVEDLTSSKEYERFRERQRQTAYARDRGLGRPTKRDRRKLEEIQ